VTGRAIIPEPEPEVAPSPPSPRPVAALRSTPPAAETGDGRRRRIFVFLTIVTVLAAFSLIIWAANRDTETSAEPGATTPATTTTTTTTITSPSTTPPAPKGPRDYAALLKLIPASIRSTCSKDDPDTGTTASANCNESSFALWTAQWTLDGQLQGIAGSCTTPPPGGPYLTTTISEDGQDVTVNCGLIPNSGGSKPFYFVAWGVNDILLTGTVYSAYGADAKGYRQTYERALSLLREVQK
jgi:hypothetical protein